MDGGFYLFLSFRAVNGLRTALGNVRGSVELSALATVPQPVQRDAFSFQCGGGQLLGYYGVAATHSGKAGGFGSYNGNIYRIFFIFDEGQIVVLFNGFHKKTQKTPSSEIDKALKIKEEYYEYKKQHAD